MQVRLEEENMRIRTQDLVVGAALLLGVCLLLRANDAVTEENAVDPGPNRADEPLREKFSLPAAVRFLDAVALTWHKQHNCFACHSDYVFLLARPAVNPKTAAPTTTRQALEHLAENPRQTDYGSTEAVMVASILAQNDAATTGKLHPTTRKALDRIWTLQREDGGWTWMKNNEPPSEVDDHYGVTMAAIGVGMAPDGYRKTPAAQKGLEKIRQYLRNNPPANMHQRAMMLLASLRVDGIMTEAERAGGCGASRAAEARWRLGIGHPGPLETVGRQRARLRIQRWIWHGLCHLCPASAGTTAEDPRIRKGIAWLKTHQRPADAGSRVP